MKTNTIQNIKKYNYLLKTITEEIDTGGNDNLFDPSAKREIEQSTYDVEDILPEMSDNGKRYFELMIEGTYKQLVDRIKKYTGMNVPDRMAVMSALMNSLNPITQIESQHKGHLENLALHTVLSVDEFKHIKNLVREGAVKFDVRIIKPNLQEAFQEFNDKVEQDAQQATEQELTQGEEADLSAIDILLEADKSKACFINFITQGEAVNSWEMFKLVKENLDKIDPRLLKLYELFAVATHAGYFMMPFFDMNGALDLSAGMAKVSPEEGEGSGYVIHAHGINFAVLIHEIVKGIYDYIGLHGKDQGALEQEDINDEKLQLMAGPTIAKQFKQAILNVIGTDNMQYINPLYAKLYGPEVTSDEIKDIIKGTPGSKQLIQSLFDEVKEEQDAYDQEGDESSSFGSDSGEEEPDTGDDWKNG
jgi:hypothetical protein